MIVEIKEIYQDRNIDKFFKENWGSDFIISGEEKLYGHDLDGFAVYDKTNIIGLLTYHILGSQAEIVSLDALKQNQGIGSSLIKKMIERAKDLKLDRLWLMTTNDNIKAINFYKNQGFVVNAVHIDAIQKSRDLGQNIPEFGYNGVPIKDEVEMEYLLKY